MDFPRKSAQNIKEKWKTDREPIEWQRLVCVLCWQQQTACYLLLSLCKCLYIFTSSDSSTNIHICSHTPRKTNRVALARLIRNTYWNFVIFPLILFISSPRSYIITFFVCGVCRSNQMFKFMSAKEPLAQLFAAHNIRTPISQDETNMLRTSEL